MDDQTTGEAKMACKLAAAPSMVADRVVMQRKITRIYTARIIVSAIPMFMLLWIMHTGLKLATEPRRDPRFDPLALSVGIVSMIFGMVYFLYGLAIVVGLALELLGWLQFPEEDTEFHGDGAVDASCSV